jgi:hypothetical protein
MIESGKLPIGSRPNDRHHLNERRLSGPAVSAPNEHPLDTYANVTSRSLRSVQRDVKA